MKVKSEDLIGIQLDYAAALATGQKVDFEADTGCLWFEERDVWFTWSPSTEWAQCGPMMESLCSIPGCLLLCPQDAPKLSICLKKCCEINYLKTLPIISGGLHFIVRPRFFPRRTT
ncbi:DUF2591 family protein [Enterobacter ludwigii]|nr:DUF2591 family protein [Enterobacter ludwigii]